MTELSTFETASTTTLRQNAIFNLYIRLSFSLADFGSAFQAFVCFFGFYLFPPLLHCGLQKKGCEEKYQNSTSSFIRQRTSFNRKKVIQASL